MVADWSKTPVMQIQVASQYSSSYSIQFIYQPTVTFTSIVNVIFGR